MTANRHTGFKAKAPEHAKCGPDLHKRKIAMLHQLVRLHVFCTMA
ncbi:hypothetical protein EV646_1248 [Kribbella antiqua]|uniref:Uncharacterized protein n=1 Tax=Kribbella antiqua TaxID=2512217 RepID=A0A4V2S1P0_9ACTN|nr:hypothetical protein [Kribbella antiqua]TCO37330.1 hypothetical protein EV646_1248 [Kribbella antiqua]